MNCFVLFSFKNLFALGNTCFANVIIQLLYHSVNLRQSILHRMKQPMSQPKENVRITRRQSALARDASLYRDLCELMYTMWSTNEVAVDPEKFIVEMGRIGPMVLSF